MSNKPILLDVVGCSDIFSRAHAKGLERLTDTFKLRSFTDTDTGKLQEFGEKYNVTELYSSVEEMLKAHDDGAVLITTPTSSHAELTVAALNAKRDVLCEKPMAMTTDEAQVMLDAAEKNQKVLHLCFMSRYAPCWMKIKELLDGNAIGKVMSGTITQYWDSGVDLYNNWRTNQSVSGGGIIADSSAHWIDIFRHLMGEINQVSCAGIPAPDSPFTHIDDSSFAFFRFQSGAIGLLRNSWRHQRPENEAETCEIYGTCGTIIGNLRTPWQEGGIQTVRLITPTETKLWSFHDPMQRFANQLAVFADLIRSRELGKASGKDGLRALEIQMACYKAMQENIYIDL